MEGTMHLVILLSGFCFLASCAPQHQYVFVNTPLTWYEARSYCRENCFDLATIDNMGEMETVLETVTGKYNDAVWIGLWKGMTFNWYWSLADNNFYNEGERNYLIWGDESYQNCGSFLNGKLYTVGCGQTLYSVCFDGNQIGEKQYVRTSAMFSWTAARDYCRTYHTDLTSVRNKAERQIIQKVVGGTQVWTGLFRDPWVWSDQAYSSMRYWNVYETVHTVVGEEACVALLGSQAGRWGDLSCEGAYPFLCNCPISRFIKVRISSQDTSVLEQNDPAVQADVLNQIKQKLRDTNVTVDFNLRWKKYPDGRVFIKEPPQ